MRTHRVNERPGDSDRARLASRRRPAATRLLYVLLGAVALSTLLAVLTSRRAFFTTEHQLKELTPPQPHPGA
jgi:hypothetical protein